MALRTHRYIAQGLLLCSPATSYRSNNKQHCDNARFSRSNRPHKTKYGLARPLFEVMGREGLGWRLTAAVDTPCWAKCELGGVVCLRTFWDIRVLFLEKASKKPPLTLMCPRSRWGQAIQQNLYTYSIFNTRGVHYKYNKSTLHIEQCCHGNNLLRTITFTRLLIGSSSFPSTLRAIPSLSNVLPWKPTK